MDKVPSGLISRITINCSSKSSVSSATSVSEIVNELNIKTIASCVVGISRIDALSDYLPIDYKHSALLLLRSSSNDNNEQEEGIIIEYGDYYPTMDLKEKYYVDKGKVIYRYKDKGGLRFYAQKYEDFLDKFCDIGYIELDIEENNQMTFDSFINQISPENKEEWTKSNYTVSPLNPKHCQNFVVEALKILNPMYNIQGVYNSDPILNRNKSTRPGFIPNIIKEELEKHMKKKKK